MPSPRPFTIRWRKSWQKRGRRKGRRRKSPWPGDLVGLVFDMFRALESVFRLKMWGLAQWWWWWWWWWDHGTISNLSRYLWLITSFSDQFFFFFCRSLPSTGSPHGVTIEFESNFGIDQHPQSACCCSRASACPVLFYFLLGTRFDFYVSRRTIINK